MLRGPSYFFYPELCGSLNQAATQSTVHTVNNATGDARATHSFDLCNSSQEPVLCVCVCVCFFLICTNLISVSYVYRDNLRSWVHASLPPCPIDVTERATTVGLFIDANWMPNSQKKKEKEKKRKKIKLNTKCEWEKCWNELNVAYFKICPPRYSAVNTEERYEIYPSRKTYDHSKVGT